MKLIQNGNQHDPEMEPEMVPEEIIWNHTENMISSLVKSSSGRDDFTEMNSSPPKSSPAEDAFT